MHPEFILLVWADFIVRPFPPSSRLSLLPGQRDKSAEINRRTLELQFHPEKSDNFKEASLAKRIVPFLWMMIIWKLMTSVEYRAGCFLMQALSFSFRDIFKWFDSPMILPSGSFKDRHSWRYECAHRLFRMNTLFRESFITCESYKPHFSLHVFRRRMTGFSDNILC